MKRKNAEKYLEMKKNWWDKLPQNEKNATTRPGSIKTK